MNKNTIGAISLSLLLALGTACSSASTEKSSIESPKAELTAQQTAKVMQLSTSEFSKKIEEEGIQLIDVRTAGEVAEGKIPSAVNIDYNSPEFKKMAAKLDPTKPVAVYCKVGGRSARAAKIFQDLGFKEVYDLEGGILSWNADGLPIEK